MADTKRLDGAQVKASTYGKFSKSGVSVDVKGFLSTSSGKSLMTQIRDARTGQLKPKSTK